MFLQLGMACWTTGISTDVVDSIDGYYAWVQDTEDLQFGMFEKRLPCFGCGIDWFLWVFLILSPPFSLISGIWIHLSLSWMLFLLQAATRFVFPLMWYYATILYFGNYYQRDPRERAGLAASAIPVSVALNN